MSTKPPGGTRDFLPAEVKRREHVTGIVRQVYERYGFEPLETPAFENIDTLLGKYGEEGNKLIFKILKRGEHEASGEADLALRYDLTVPLARVVAQYQNELPKFFKRYQIQPVWRADRPAKGRFREFYQCDIDSIGSTSPVVEAEQLSAVTEVLTTLGFGDFTIQLNHRVLLTAMLEAASVPAGLHGEALVAIDKLDKIGRDGVRKELVARGVTDESASTCLDAFEDVPSFERLVQASARGSAAQYEIDRILSLELGTPAYGHVSFVPRLARGLSYYTGAIMEITVPDLAGSLGGGGRYYNLVVMFLGRDVPACGFSLGLERIIVVMTERGMFPDSVVKNAVDIVVTFPDEGSRAETLNLARELRQARWRVDVFPDAARKFDKPLKYAAARGARVMAIFGENEIARGEASIRDLSSREQQAVPRADAAAHIARLLGT